MIQRKIYSDKVNNIFLSTKSIKYEQLSQYSFKKAHEYFDENEPLGGWWDPKKHPFR